jgi:hypothetical protein
LIRHNQKEITTQTSWTRDQQTLLRKPDVRTLPALPTAESCHPLSIGGKAIRNEAVASERAGTRIAAA